MNKQKGFTPILILIVFLVLGGVGFLLFKNTKVNPSPTPLGSPKPSAEAATPDPTADWKKYTNSTHNYALKYPSEFDVSLDETWARPEDHVSVKSPDSNINLDFTNGAQGSDCANALCESQRELEFTISGEQFVATEHYPDAFNNYSFEIYIPDNQGNERISISVKYKNPPDVKTIDQILSTFKFIN